MANKMQKQLKQLNIFPGKIRQWVLSKALGKMVPFVGTASIRFLEVTPEKVVATIPNKRKNQNHIQSVHAAATALLAETVSGICFGLNVPDNKLPLIKSMDVKYTKRTQGDLIAWAAFNPEDLERLQNDDKGDVAFNVNMQDETGEVTNEIIMVWAWVPKKR